MPVHPSSAYLVCSLVFTGLHSRPDVTMTYQQLSTSGSLCQLVFSSSTINIPRSSDVFSCVIFFSGSIPLNIFLTKQMYRRNVPFVKKFGLAVVCQRPPRWPSGKASVSRAEDPGFEYRLPLNFFGVESYQLLKNWHSNG